MKAKVADCDCEIPGLDGIIADTVSPFKELETSHMQEKYFRESHSLVVSLLSVLNTN